MKSLVTGVAGFIGAHVAERLVSAGHDVVGIDDLSGGDVNNIPENVKFIQASINDNLDIMFKTEHFDYVYHLAAYAAEGLSHHIPVFNYENNVSGSVNLIRNAVKYGVKHFVFTSSIAVYGHSTNGEKFDEETLCQPCDPYGIAKYAVEQHLKSSFEYFGRPNYTIFRPHNVFGPKQNISDPYRNVVGIFLSKILNDEPMPIFGDGQQTRSFSYIDAVANCISKAPDTRGALNMTINIGGDEPMSVKQLAQTISELFQQPENVVHLPERKEVKHAHSDHSLAHSIFPLEHKDQTSIRGGLEKTILSIAGKEVPLPTECPSEIEILEKMPPSWLKRLQTDV